VEKSNILFRITCVCTLHIVLCTSSYSQTKKNSGDRSRTIDSLFGQLKKLHSSPKTFTADTQYVNALNSLAAEFMNNDPDTAIILSMQALALSQQVKFERGTAKANSCIGVSEKNKGNYQSALDHHFKALAVFGSVKDLKHVASVTLNIANVYMQQSDFAHALQYYYNALKMNEGLGNTGEVGKILNGIGTVYAAQGDYSKALYYFFSALKKDEGLGKKNEIGKILCNMGNVYLYQNNYAAAETYYLKSLQTREEIGDKTGIAQTLGNIGIVYEHEGDYSRALIYHFRGVEIMKEIGDEKGLSVELCNIGTVYNELAKNTNIKSRKDSLYQRSLAYFSQARELAHKLGDMNGIAADLANMGVVYTQTGRFDLAEKNLLRAVFLADSIRNLEYYSQFELYLTRLFETTGRSRLALIHYKKYIAARDSITNDDNIKKQTRLEMQFDFDKKTAADSVRVAEEKKVVAAELKSEQNQRYSLYGGLVLVLVFAGVMYNRFRVTQKQKVVIEEQKLMVEEQKMAVEEKQKEVLDSIYYARRIQRALLPGEKYFEKNIPKN
jgi:tetratricopeptide (TPR) repeat protein